MHQFPPPIYVYIETDASKIFGRGTILHLGSKFDQRGNWLTQKSFATGYMHHHQRFPRTRELITLTAPTAAISALVDNDIDHPGATLIATRYGFDLQSVKLTCSDVVRTLQSAPRKYSGTRWEPKVDGDLAKSSSNPHSHRWKSPFFWVKFACIYLYIYIL